MKSRRRLASCILSTLLFTTFTPADAATSTFGSSTGTAQYASTNFGQTFTMPAAGGDLVSISDIYVAFRGTTGLGVVQMKLYTAPSKATLVATAASTCADNVTDYDNFQGVTCTFTFSGVSLSGSTSYYFEVARVSGEASFYMWQYNTNGYSGGDMYQNGTLYSGWDNKFTLTYNTISTPVSTFTIADSNFTYRTGSNIAFQSNVAGTAKFRANGKVIGGCASKLLTAGNSFSVTCVYKPSWHQPTTITVDFIPSDSSYTRQSFTSAQKKVLFRSGTRN